MIIEIRQLNKQLTFLLVLTFLFLFSGCSVLGDDDFNDALDAYKRQDYKTAYRLWLPLAEQGYAPAQFNLGVMYERGRGVPQDYKEAVKWYHLSKEKGLRNFWYVTGEKKGETHYKNWKKEGVEKKWYKSGRKKSLKHYKNGIENGIRKEWNEDGKLTFQGNFVDGVEEIK